MQDKYAHDIQTNFAILYINCKGNNLIIAGKPQLS